ncbi:MAG TPA: PD-(D/E)XK nuclease family protein [Candidatus Binatia bacterium]
MTESGSMSRTFNGAAITAVQSGSAAVRLREARRFLEQFEPGAEVLLLGASRGSVDDLARVISLEKGATFGLHRLSFTQLAARLAVMELAARERAPTTTLGHEAVATRAAFEARSDNALEYFSPVSQTPGFPKALARTLLDLRLAAVASGDLARLPRSGTDLAALLDRVDTFLNDAGASDRASLFETTTKALGSPVTGWPPMPLLLLDVPFQSEIEAQFLWKLVQQSPHVMITVPAGDASAVSQLEKRGVRLEIVEEAEQNDLTQLAHYLFSKDPPPERTRTGELVWFSAPGEGRECVEIARRILKEADRGVRFDEIAIVIRSTQQYVGLLEHALARAGVPAYFDRGTRRPDPTGRAFLAILSCATENFSAKRFAEYLSLAQVPSLDDSGKAPVRFGHSTWVASRDDVFGVLSERAPEEPDDSDSSGDDDQRSATNINGDQAVVAGTLRAPWKWESLLVESAVIGGSARWARRLNGLAAEYELKIRELTSEQPDSPRIARLERERQNLAYLRGFALPLIEEMSAWPQQAMWGDWIQRLEEIAPQVLRRPEFVLRVLADLRPMAAVGPVSLAEVRDVLADRLAALEVEPPAHRYGRVFVSSSDQVRGRVFRVAFVPGLAERLFPQKLREDPLLLDDLRREIGGELTLQEDRAEHERLLLRLASGVATERLYVSFPRIETAEARARVPSFYALEIMRAVTGRIPDHQQLELEASEEASASLAWPAPLRPEDAIDDFEHDLSVLRILMRGEADVKGHAHYLLRLNDAVRRSASERWARARQPWSPYDGLVRVTEATRPFLQSQRLTSRPWSVSALQNYAYCPYRFLLSAMYHLEPLEEPKPLERMDPLTKGRLFHEVLAEFFRALKQRKMALAPTPLDAVLEVLDGTLTRIAANYAELLAPAVDRVWQDEVASIRTDLHIWARELAASTGWEPWLFEFAFGLPDLPGWDPDSRREPVSIDGRFILRGAIDLIERKPGTKILRVTDHKTSKNRSERGSVIGGGQQLQPVIYSLAVEAATGCSVESARFSYCTTAGGFTEHNVPINDRTRGMGIEALEIIDRAVELGMLPPAPAEKACGFCDFLPVCGPNQERRARRKSHKEIADLIELRGRP